MTETIDAKVLGGLFATPPSEFVAARNALAKSLRAGGGRDAAARVAALRRPSWVDWALNTLAADHNDEVARFADAAANLRDAQAASIEQRDGPDLRAALSELRAAVSGLSKLSAGVLAEVGRPPDSAEVAARLGEVAASPSAVEQLRAGVLGSEDPDEPGPFADLRPAQSPKRRATTAASSWSSKADPAGARPAHQGKERAAEVPDELAARRAEREARQAEERRRAEEEAAHRAAAAEAAAAQQREEERTAAEADVETAEAALAAAEQTLAEAEQAVVDGRTAVIAAETALRTARQRAERLSRQR